MGNSSWIGLLAGVALSAGAFHAAGAAEQARAELANAPGESVGQVSLIQTPNGSLLHVKLMNMAAAGHFNPAGAADPRIACGVIAK